VKLSRRTLARSAGASLMMAPFYKLLQPRPAFAAPGRAKRLFIFHTQPCDTGTWNPLNVTGESSFTFAPMQEALNEVKPHLVLLDGLSPLRPQDNHFSPHALTGVGREPRPDKGIISIEQFIGDALEKTPDKRPIKTLLLGTSAGSEAVFYRNSARLTTIASPLSAFNTVFANIGAGTGPSPTEILGRRKSILDVVRADVNELQTALGTAEKQKLDLHLESLRQFEMRIADNAKNGGGATCTKPANPTEEVGAASKNTLADMAHLDLIVNAFACDITRLGAVQWGNSHTWQFDTPTGLRNELHMGIIHVQKDAEAVKIENWLAGQFARIIEKLKAIPEPDGSGTLFDNTLMIWTRDFGDADAHNSSSMKFVLAQGQGGYLKTAPTGRYIKGVSGNKRQERILLNLAEAMGVTTFDGFGDISADFKPNKTPLSELRT
jgi:Protein of unknown function (DUF1552)